MTGKADRAGYANVFGHSRERAAQFPNVGGHRNGYTAASPHGCLGNLAPYQVFAARPPAVKLAAQEHAR
jgi:hypothetical protein